jgi:phage/plasmid-associated DNA primase
MKTDFESAFPPALDDDRDQAPRLRPVAVDEKKESELTKLHRKVTSFLRTDGGAAELFAYLLGDQVRYDHSRKRWLIWDEHRWTPDDDGNINRLALTIAKLVRDAANDDALGLADDESKKAFGWGLDLTKRPRHEAVVAMARTVKPIADSGKDWDAAPGLLGVPNGVVELRSGKLRNGYRGDRITKQAGVAFDPKATCPRWEQFVREVLDDEATVEYVQSLAGYSLTGEASEDKLIFLMGIGGNGKTTLLNVLRTIAGDYAQEVSAMAFLSAREFAHTTEVADLEGSRFATCEEIGDAKLNANRIKQLSGGSPITARKMKQDTRTSSRRGSCGSRRTACPKRTTTVERSGGGSSRSTSRRSSSSRMSLTSRRSSPRSSRAFSLGLYGVRSTTTRTGLATCPRP